MAKNLVGAWQRKNGGELAFSETLAEILITTGAFGVNKAAIAKVLASLTISLMESMIDGRQDLRRIRARDLDQVQVLWSQAGFPDATASPA